jgi:hypothetical protein
MVFLLGLLWVSTKVPVTQLVRLRSSLLVEAFLLAVEVAVGQVGQERYDLGRWIASCYAGLSFLPFFILICSCACFFEFCCVSKFFDQNSAADIGRFTTRSWTGVSE